MSDYALGIDIGTTYTGASVVTHGHAEMASLATHAVVVPTVAWMGSEGEWLVGTTAERRGMTDPGQLTRYFKRRFGDTSPLVLGSSPVSIEHVTAEVLRWVQAQVSEQQGETPSSVAIAHPAPWGEYKLDLLRGAAAEAGMGGAMLVAEPVAAAINYESERGIDPGDLICVYDFGGGTFDASILRSTGDGFELVGQPDGIERLGGIDLDAAILAHVQRTVGRSVATEAESGDPAAVRLRDECRSAKEALSEDSETSIAYVDDKSEQLIRLTRSEFEDMCRAPIRQTLNLVSRVVAAADLTPEDLSAILLVGGSSRIPLVAEMVSAEFGRPVAVDAHPKHAVALGAARLASRPAMDGKTGSVPVVPLAAGAAAAGAAVGAAAATDAAADTAGEHGPATESTSKADAPVARERDRSRLAVLAGVAVALVVVVGGLAWWFSRDDDQPPAEATDTFECCPLEGLGWPAGALPLGSGVASTFAEVSVRSSTDGEVWSFGADREPRETTSTGGHLMDIVTVGAENGFELWVSDVQENRIAVLDSDSLESITSVAVGSEPQGLALADDGSLWVANSGEGTVSVIDPAAKAVTSTIDVPAGPTSIHADGSSMWVASTESDSVSMLSVADRAVESTVDVGDGPTSVVAFGERIFVANALAGTVTVLDRADLADATSATTVDTGGAVGVSSSVVAGRAAVVIGDSGGLALLDIETGLLEATLAGFERSAGVLETVTDQAELVWVSDYDTGAITVYPVAALRDAVDRGEAGGSISNIGEQIIEVGGSPRGISPIKGGVIVELFPGDQVAFIDEVTFEVTLLSPGASEQGPAVTNDTTDDDTTVTHTTELGIITVPDVVGRTESEARGVLGEAGLVVAMTTASSETVPLGIVISTSPAAFTEVEVGSTVTIVVSSGPDVPITGPSPPNPPLTAPDQVAEQ